MDSRQTRAFSRRLRRDLGIVDGYVFIFNGRVHARSFRPGCAPGELGGPLPPPFASAPSVPAWPSVPLGDYETTLSVLRDAVVADEVMNS